jgi:hypothetical protein
MWELTKPRLGLRRVTKQFRIDQQATRKETFHGDALLREKTYTEYRFTALHLCFEFCERFVCNTGMNTAKT